jgi:hypothetical protein
MYLYLTMMILERILLMMVKTWGRMRMRPLLRRVMLMDTWSKYDNVLQSSHIR